MARKGGLDRGITRRKGREGWWVRLYQNGRERWFKCDTKSQATALYGRLKADAREGKYFPEKFAPAKDITLRAWIGRYLEGSTNKNLVNDRHYGRFWSLLLGKRLLSVITTEDLRRVQAKIRAKEGKAPATINRHFAFLRHVLMLAVQDGRLARNPVSGVKFFPEARRTRFLTDAELAQLQKVMSLPAWRLTAFAIETGLRREEQFRLRWDQVSLETSTLTIPLPKGGKTRHVPLSEEAKRILRSLDSFIRSPWVFPSPQDPLRPCSPASFVTHVFKVALRRAGISGACWHTLRHTAASRRIMAGVDLYSVKELLGHREIQTTMRYAHLAPGHLQEAVNRGSLNGTVTETVTNEQTPATSKIKAGLEVIADTGKEGWLGDQDSNLGNQIQSLMSYH